MYIHTYIHIYIYIYIYIGPTLRLKGSSLVGSWSTLTILK